LARIIIFGGQGYLGQNIIANLSNEHQFLSLGRRQKKQFKDLTYDHKSINDSDLVERLNSFNADYFIILVNNYRNILLYSRKYREDVEGLIQSFSQEIWQVCTSTSTEEKYDKIVINALKYFKDLLTWDKMMPFFAQNISNLMESLILPNLQITSKI